MNGDGFGLRAPTERMRAIGEQMDEVAAERERQRAERPAIEVGMTVCGKVVDRDGYPTIVGVVYDMPDAESVDVVAQDLSLRVSSRPSGSRQAKGLDLGRLVTLPLSGIDWDACYEESDASRRSAMLKAARRLWLAVGVGSGQLSPVECRLLEAANTLLEAST